MAGMLGESPAIINGMALTLTGFPRPLSFSCFWFSFLHISSEAWRLHVNFPEWVKWV